MLLFLTVQQVMDLQTLTEHLPWTKHMAGPSRSGERPGFWVALIAVGNDQEPRDNHCCVLYLLLLLSELSFFFALSSYCCIDLEQPHFPILVWLLRDCILPLNVPFYILTGDSSDLSEGHELWVVLVVVVMSLHNDVDIKSVHLILRMPFKWQKLHKYWQIDPVWSTVWMWTWKRPKIMEKRE